jgi:alkylation response protein AidB-like acyl-CoA dehydrogenase
MNATTIAHDPAPAAASLQTTNIYQTAEALERHLGDPMDPDSPMSYRDIMALDEREEYPERHLELLHSWGLQRQFVPHEHGGMLDSYQRVLMLHRTVARRDITTATCGMLYSIGYSALLVGGSEAQKRRYGDLLLKGGKIAWGLSEQASGSDVIGNATTAVRTANGYRINGCKWPIGYASRGDAIMIYARTGEGAQPNAFTVFMFDKRDADRECFTHMQRERLFGLRGMDLSSIRFNDLDLPESAVVGREGEGLEIVLKSAQLMRSGVIAASLGGLDTALRLALGFARERRLFGTVLAENDITRRQLCESFADLLIGEIQMMATSRALHLNPRQLNLWASVAKYQVPTMVERALQNLATVIGCRYYLRENFGYGVFQKMVRDAGMVSFVDGNTLVNLKVIALQMEMTFARIARNSGHIDERVGAELARLFDPLGEVPPAGFSQLTVFSRGDDPILEGFGDSLERLSALTAVDGIDRGALQRALDLGARLLRRVHQLAEDTASDRRRIGREFNQSADMFALARRYALLHAAASCVHYALYGAPQVGGAMADLAWLAPCLTRIEQQFDPQRTIIGAEDARCLSAIMHRLYEEHRAFGPVPYQLAGESRPLSAWRQLYA